MNTDTAATGQMGKTGSGETKTAAAQSAGKFLTFYLAGEEYGIEIQKVQEIIGMAPVTRVPRTPAFIKGLMNLRGKIIPIVDLRIKLAMEAGEHTGETCIIVVHAEGAATGIIVDRVSEVVDISFGDISPAPTFGAERPTDYILGIGKREDKVRILLDVDKALSTMDPVRMSLLPEGSEMQTV